MQEATTSSDSHITIQMLYFASARTTLGKSNESLSIPSSPPFPISKLKAFLLETNGNNPELKTVLDKSALSVNEEIIYDDDEVVLKEGDVVAVIPPVSGG
jgi:molybdopterin converting factor small subunit